MSSLAPPHPILSAVTVGVCGGERGVSATRQQRRHRACLGHASTVVVLVVVVVVVVIVSVSASSAVQRASSHTAICCTVALNRSKSSARLNASAGPRTALRRRHRQVSRVRLCLPCTRHGRECYWRNRPAHITGALGGLCAAGMGEAGGWWWCRAVGVTAHCSGGRGGGWC